MDNTEKAELARSWFEYVSEPREMWRVKDEFRGDGPAHDLSYAAHDNGETLPDDYRYQFLVDALDAISNENGAEGLEPDVYTSGLTEWLNSSSARVFYLSEALNAWGGAVDGFQLLGQAQLQEMLEVYLEVEKWI